MSRYNEEKKILGAVDFDDLIERPLTLLEHPDVLRQLRARWRYALVDEYQDTNTLQFQFLRRLMGADGNLCVVGDDDQSIYGWRGADQRNILEFERQFPSCQAIYLTANYRCKAPILDAQTSSLRTTATAKRSADRGAERATCRLQIFSDNELEVSRAQRSLGTPASRWIKWRSSFVAALRRRCSRLS